MIDDNQPDPLADLRTRIDSVDDKLVRLLNERAEISLAVGRIKADSDEQVFKPFREHELIEKLTGRNVGPLPERHLRAIYREILSSSRRLQRPERVVYLGPLGTFSYFAAIAHLGRSAELDPRANFTEIFQAVADGDAELGIVPIENSVQGTVVQVVDLFMQFPVYIQAELYHRVSHGLMSRCSDLSEVTEIYSHQQPLEQCRGWLHSHFPKTPRRGVGSTAEAAQIVADGPKTAACIGNIRLAKMFGLNVLAERIEDFPDNWTRFLVIGPQPPAGNGNRDKTSILFTASDSPGSLASVLNTLAGRGINMTKLESRPFKGEKWKYVFFADLDCDLTAEDYQALLDDLRRQCQTLRVLGSYPAGNQNASEG